MLRLAALLLLFAPLSAHSLLTWESDDSWHELRGELRLLGLYLDNPDQPLLFDEPSNQGPSAIGRLLIDGGVGEQLGYSINIYQSYIAADLSQNRLDVERSSQLEHAWDDEDYNRLALDQIYLSYRLPDIDFQLGRQPINLATAFFFSPNDLFAPFAAQSFYRIYKPGVDALRIEHDMGGLSRAGMIHVLGYSVDPGSDTGWSRGPSSERSSTLLTANFLWHQFEWSVMVGDHQRADLIGLALQGEWGVSGVGLRFEANRQQSDNTTAQYTLGADYRWPNSLHLRGEFYINNIGATSISEYPQTPLQQPSLPMARRYLAFGTGYTFSPLINIDATLLGNRVDQSWLLAMNMGYSLSDEMDLSLTVTTPLDHSVPNYPLKSEYALSPTTVSIEVRTGL